MSKDHQYDGVKQLKCIGRYVLCNKTLGKGNFARVELAAHTLINNKVAVKIIDMNNIKDDYVRRNLFREARLLRKLAHPNIIKLFETIKYTTQSHTLYCLVMELAEGGELLTHVKNNNEFKRLEENKARPFVRQLISSLYYLHSKGIVHRDLKMENILLDKQKQQVKIIDFGLSNHHEQGELLSTHCGSPEYAAPELFVAGRQYGAEVDVWSLGVNVYAMLVGKLPFRSSRSASNPRAKLLQQITAGLGSHQEADAAHLHPSCINLIKGMLQPDPCKRLKLTAVMQHPWITNKGTWPLYPYISPKVNEALEKQVIYQISRLLKLNQTDIKRAISANQCDWITAIYHLLMRDKEIQLGTNKLSDTSLSGEITESTSGVGTSIGDENEITSRSAKTIEQLASNKAIEQLANTKTIEQIANMGITRKNSAQKSVTKQQVTSSKSNPGSNITKSSTLNTKSSVNSVKSANVSNVIKTLTNGVTSAKISNNAKAMSPAALRPKTAQDSRNVVEAPVTPELKKRNSATYPRTVSSMSYKMQSKPDHDTAMFTMPKIGRSARHIATKAIINKETEQKDKRRIVQSGTEREKQPTTPTYTPLASHNNKTYKHQNSLLDTQKILSHIYKSNRNGRTYVINGREAGHNGAHTNTRDSHTSSAQCNQQEKQPRYYVSGGRSNELKIEGSEKSSPKSALTRLVEEKYIDCKHKHAWSYKSDERKKSEEMSWSHKDTRSRSRDYSASKNAELPNISQKACASQVSKQLHLLRQRLQQAREEYNVK